jgi:hypothetical protein
MSGTINTRRAYRAAIALNAYQRAIDELDFETAITDLIAHLGHLARKRKLDYVALVRRGIRSWAFEEHEPNGIGPSPPVRLTIGRISLERTKLRAEKGGRT